MSDLGFALGRALLALIFIISGFGKLAAVAGIAKMLGDKGFPQPVAFGYAVGALELIGGLMVLVGFKTRSAALALAAFTAATIFAAHDFWTFEGAQYMAQRTHALKNLAILGGFLVLAASGPGRYSFDGRRG